MGLLYVCISVYARELCMQRNGSVCMCVFLLVWEIKLNSKSVIMVVWKEGREGALILQVDGDFFSLFSTPS